MKHRYTQFSKRMISKFSFSLLFILSGLSVNAADYYWVGGSGNWSDHFNHWAKVSGGSVFRSQMPSPLDNVIFDANSFPAGGTLNCGVNVFCNNMTWISAVTTNPTLSVGIDVRYCHCERSVVS